MQVYYSVVVQTNNGHGTASAFCQDGLNDAFSEALQSCDYYRQVCGYSPSFSIYVVCNRCQGMGTVAASKRTVRKCCPDCKGEVPAEVVSNVHYPTFFEKVC